MRWSKAFATAAAFALSPAWRNAEIRGPLRISMADIPLTTGQPDRGAGAYQFTGYTSTTRWWRGKWTSPDRPAS